MRSNDVRSEPRRLARRGFISYTLQAAALCAALTFCGSAASALGADIGGKRGVDVYTVNAYIGADLAPALAVDPDNLEELVQVTTKIYVEIVQSRPELRMAAIAADIAARRPDIVGGVELYRLELAPMVPPGAPGEYTIVHDYLDLLTDALAAMGAHYRVEVVSTEHQVELPLLNPANMQELLWGRLTDHEAILVRSDLPPGHLRITNPQTGQFHTRIVIPDVLDLKRGWCSVDAFVRGERFRVICAHLEDDAAPPIQYAQAQELLAGPAATPLPLILLGDFNADPLGRNGTVTYPLFAEAGLTDSWLRVNPGNPAGGLTWGHDAALADPADALEWRLDLVLYRGAKLSPVAVETIDLPTGSSQPPLWASDHRALATSFRIGNPRPAAAPAAINRLVPKRR